MNRIATILLAAGVVFALCPAAEAAPIISDPTLDTANDLMDIGGGTVFNCDINGVSGTSGGGPWVTYAGGNLYDNDTSSDTCTQFTGSSTNPALVGVYNMSSQVQLGGFAVTITDLRHQGYEFKIQGSNDTTNGYGGTWTDIFTYTGDLTANKTYRWNASDNTFLSSASFDSFRLAENTAYKRYAEVEFFDVPEPVTAVLLGLGGLGLVIRRRRRRS